MEVKFLDQFSTRKPMVPSPRAHSNGIAIFGNQTHQTHTSVDASFSYFKLISQPVYVIIK